MAFLRSFTQEMADLFLIGTGFPGPAKPICLTLWLPSTSKAVQPSKIILFTGSFQYITAPTRPRPASVLAESYPPRPDSDLKRHPTHGACQTHHIRPTDRGHGARAGLAAAPRRGRGRVQRAWRKLRARSNLPPPQYCAFCSAVHASSERRSAERCRERRRGRGIDGKHG